MAINNLEDAVREFFFYQRGTAGGFQTALFDLIHKADSENKARLAKAFPNQVQAFDLWMTDSEGGKGLFRQYGLVNEM